MVENMLGKLGGHSMFAGGTRRLQMCGDCRVVDMMENKAEAIDLRLTEEMSCAAAPRSAARANFYGLIARLFYAPPDAAAARAAAAGAPALEAEATRRALAAAWRELVEALPHAPFPAALRGRAHRALRRHRQGGGDAVPLALRAAPQRPTTRWSSCAQQLARLGHRRGARRCRSTKTTSAACAKPCDSLLQCSSDRRKSSSAFFERFVYRGAARVLRCGNAPRTGAFLPRGGALRARVLRDREERVRDGG